MTTDAIILDDDASRLVRPRVHGWLAGSYWSPGLARNTFERAVVGSHCLGAYDEEAGQVGFARAITDRATFAWIADVWVDEAGRGSGLGRRMVRWFLDHPDYAGIRRVALVTRDAHGVYAPLGFHPPLRPQNYMERLDAGAAALLRDQPAAVPGELA